jgi:hypothetical protein
LWSVEVAVAVAVLRVVQMLDIQQAVAAVALLEMLMYPTLLSYPVKLSRFLLVVAAVAAVLEMVSIQVLLPVKQVGLHL